MTGQTLTNSFPRQRDYDGYLCVPFYPSHLRNTQYAIRAFNIELASIRENISKPEIGKMRMQFWKDTLDKIYAVIFFSLETQDYNSEINYLYYRVNHHNNLLLWLYQKL